MVPLRMGSLALDSNHRHHQVTLRCLRLSQDNTMSNRSRGVSSTIVEIVPYDQRKPLYKTGALSRYHETCRGPSGIQTLELTISIFLEYEESTNLDSKYSPN